MKTMRVILLIALVSFCFTSSQAQFGFYEFGARRQSLAFADVAMNGPWSLFNNVAGITGIENTYIMAGYQRYEQVTGFDRYAVGLIKPIRSTAIGVSVYGFGDEISSERKVALSVAHKAGRFSLGVNTHFSQISVEGFESRFFWMVDIGGLAELSDRLNIGMHISNLNQTKIAEFPEANLPLSLEIGLSYRPVEELNILFEIEQATISEMQAGFAMEYQPVESWKMRGGYQLERQQLFGGIGFGKRHFEIDYAFAYQSFFGFSHQLGLLFNWLRYEK
jgi:hypothetical protein